MNFDRHHMETKNIGIFSDFSEEFEKSDVPSLLKLCEKYNIYIKQHNTDYLESNFLAKHPKFGIHAANVAPEYGVAETKRLFELIEEHKEQNNLKKIESLEQKLINNLDENSYSELIKLKSQLNRE